MKKEMMVIALVSFFLIMIASMSVAASDHEAHHPDKKHPATTSSPSGMHGSGMHGSGMHGSGMHGSGMMKYHCVNRFLAQKEKLNLSDDQIAKLKAIQSDSHKENIRTRAEVEISRLELSELLDSNDWSLEAAESLIRKTLKLEGDIRVRHFKKLSDAREVLTKEQLKKALHGNGSEQLEDLF